MERMEPKERMLHEAAVEGSVTSLVRLLQEDRLLLDRFLAGCYTETPLHVAAMLGHLEFTKGILSRKPGLAAELDFRRSSPLHLATANGHLEVAKALLSVHPEMCLALDRNDRNPLHIAVIKGRVEILTELVQAKPEAAQVRVDRGETILHLCVKHYQLEALKVLVETIDDHEFVNSMDDDSCTVLHLAVADKQIESINFMVTKTTIDVNALNCYGFTALDISLACSQRDQKDIDIRDSLLRVGAVRAQDISSSSVHELEAISTIGLSSATTNQTTALHPRGRGRTHNQLPRKQKNNWLENKQHALMVVASLIATMAFQAGINPPGGVWPDDLFDGPDLKHSAGYSVLANKYPNRFALFLGLNTIGFLASLSVILLLISGLPFKCRFFVWIQMMIMWVAILSMILAYAASTISLTTYTLLDTPFYYVLIAPSIVFFALMGYLLLGHTIRLTIKMVRCGIRLMRRERESTSSIMMNQATV